MKILSWNVNGIRAVLKKGFFDFLEKAAPDILCMQETKVADAARIKAELDFPGYEKFWNPADRPGYSGTAILAKKGIKAVLGAKLPWDDEGRIQILEFKDFYLVNVYFPNANHALSRLDFKIDFNGKLLKHLKKIEKKKPVVICGDFNVAHKEIDLARPKQNEGNPGYTAEEREWMSKFLEAGFVDTYRYFNPEKIEYTWWSYRTFARGKNIGWRIDYFCVSEKLIKKIKKAYILNEIHGSDHCPAGVEI